MLFELLRLLAVWMKHFLLAGYMTGGNVFPKPLTPAEEERYIDEMRAGNLQARDILIERNLRLVAHVVKKYASAPGADAEDLISIGTIGLIKAIDSFDNGKKIRLATYAARCIHNEILMHFRAQKHKQNELSLDDPVGADDDGNSISLMHIVHEETEDIDNSILLKGHIERLYECIRLFLNPREREVVCLRYGLGSCEPLAQREVAQKLKISRSYVSRIEKKALEKLKDRMESLGVDGGELF